MAGCSQRASAVREDPPEVFKRDLLVWGLQRFHQLSEVSFTDGLPKTSHPFLESSFGYPPRLGSSKHRKRLPHRLLTQSLFLLQRDLSVRRVDLLKIFYIIWGKLQSDCFHCLSDFVQEGSLRLFLLLLLVALRERKIRLLLFHLARERRALLIYTWLIWVSNA